MKHALAMMLIAGCAAPDGSTDEADGDGAATQLISDGSYRLSSRIDVTVEALLPARGELVVATLRGLSSNPARALIDAAGDAGVPAVDELYDLLPGVLADQIEGWINDEIAGVRIAGVPVTAYAGRVAGLADVALRRFAIDSELAIRGGVASHRLTAIDLAPAGLAIELPIGELPDELVARDTTAQVSGGALALGEQRYGLAYGEYVWRGLEAASQAEFGARIRGALGGAIDCAAVARGVAGQCMFGACVGHEALLTRVCDGGLDAVVGLAHDRIAELRFEALHFASGRATLVDADRDGIADQIIAGTWQAELDLGQGLRRAPATFTGAR